MWDDIVDDEGVILLDKVWRLDDMYEATTRIMSEFVPNYVAPDEPVHVNRSARADFVPSQTQCRKIQLLFEEDFGIYENCTP